jgi:lysophospholipase L1-like esterase
VRKQAFRLIAMVVVLASLSLGAPPAGAGTDGFYVSLGDSLSVGFQPNRGETEKGYVDELWRRVLDTMPTLQLQKFGCVGETTTSMVDGTGSLCTYDAGSQLAEAVAFLEANAGQISFVTIDIGANDVVDGCMDFDTGVLNRTCVEELLPDLSARVTSIVDALRAAVGPDVPVVGMTYYDPFLGLWGLVPGGKVLARTAQRAWRTFDAALTEAYVGAGAAVADVAATFRTDDFETKVVVDGRRVPINVALTCRWTWFCSKVYEGDPHANTIGYRKIARTFHQVLTPLLV